jgi:integrase
LIVAESVTEVAGRLVWSLPKTNRTRTVPFPPSLAPQLAASCKGKGPDDPLFTAPEGGTLRLGNWRRRVFDPACRAAGLVDVTPHDLRHTAASLAIASGANVKAVQQILGHASAAMTLDVYAGLFGDDLDAVALALDGLVPPLCPLGVAEGQKPIGSDEADGG